MPVSKKADFILAFNKDDDEDVRDAYTKFKSNNPGEPISPMIDAYTSGIALACVLELKDATGKIAEAELQLAVYHAAMLWKLRHLMIMKWNSQLTDADIERMPSIVGWVVIGHTWFLYISSLRPDGSIVGAFITSVIRSNSATNPYCIRCAKVHSIACKQILAHITAFFYS